MKTLSILTAAASILLAISEPTLAQSRTQPQRSSDAYSAYARDADNAFWAAPYVYAPNVPAPYAPAYGAQGRDPDYPSGSYVLPYRGPVGSTRNDW
jgi:hypothetical protein